MMSLHERRCYSFNDIGILVEEELQELGVVTDVVKQPSSVVLVENRWMYVRLLSGTLGGFSPLCLCHPLINIFYHNSSDISSENFVLDQLILSLFLSFLFLSLFCLIS